MKARARTTRIAIGLEPLEGRRVLSTAGAALMVPLTTDLVYGISYLDLQGSAHGSTKTVRSNPDVGGSLNFHGSGNVRGMGLVQITGTVHGTGFILNGHPQGTITLSNAKGSFTLHLQGPSQHGFQSPRSGVYTFNSTSGTGAFQKDFGNGTVELKLGKNSFTMTFHGKPNVY